MYQSSKTTFYIICIIALLILCGCVSANDTDNDLKSWELYAESSMKKFIAENDYVSLYEVISLQRQTDSENLEFAELKLIWDFKGLGPLTQKIENPEPRDVIPSYYFFLKDDYSEVMAGNKDLANLNRVEVENSEGEKEYKPQFYKSYLYLITSNNESILYGLPISSINYDPITQFMYNNQKNQSK